MLKVSDVVRLVVVLWANQVVSAQYPNCFEVKTSDWPEADYSSIEGANVNGIPQHKVQEKCQTACRGRSVTFFGIRRNGPSGPRARCYCGGNFDNIQNSPQQLCSHKCVYKTIACGLSENRTILMSVYTVCNSNEYGPTCAKSCPMHCVWDVCQLISGDCHIGCQSGWYGGTCTQSCTNCNSGCIQDDGTCEPGGCKSGFYGEKCEISCSDNCKDDICQQTGGKCVSCKKGYYGDFCNDKCLNCMNGCNQVDGICETGGCIAGFFGDKCVYRCHQNCEGGCDQLTAACIDCKDMFYDVNCTESCSNCMNDCQRNGSCHNGGCKDGFYGIKCDLACSNCVSGCEHLHGVCSGGCVEGHYGEKCNMPCTNCDEGCKQDTGLCRSGCLDGYHGNKCDMECPEGCSDKMCFQENGTCAECENGYYNNICELACPTNCKDNTCDFEDGSCMVKENGLTGGEIAGISIAVIIVLAGVIICVFFLHRRMNKPKAASSGRNLGFDDLENEQTPTKPELPVHPLMKPVSPIAKQKAVSSASYIGSDNSEHDQRQPNSELPVHKPEKPVPQIHKPKATSSARNHGLEMEIEQRLSIFPPEKPNPEIVPAASNHTYEDFHDHRPNENAKIIAVEDFPRYVSSRMVPKDMFEDEYESLPSQQLYPWDAAHVDESLKLKNRFKDIYPYDHNRVVLSKLTNDPFSDYINASRMKGFHPEDAFIATLAPRKLTVNDFWRMIWQEKVDTVVMVTNLVELGAPKCVQYWPDVGCSFMFGKLHVELCKEDAWPHYAIRKMVVTKGNAKRTVVQYHFTVWPDHGVPDSVQLLNFRRKISPKIGQGRPVIIHCSAGVGRTGTLIALDYLIKQAEKQGSLDVYNCVYTLRHQRKSIIQTAEQYAFLHEALAVYFELHGDTVVTADHLMAVKPTMIGSKTTGSKSALEYKMLAKLDPQQMAYDRDYPLDPANINKNRDRKILPRMKKRVFLSRSKGCSDYINAVTVDSFCKIDAYYVTHLPLSNTVLDFWTMMDDSDSRSIVMLLTQKQKQGMPQFLPAKNKPLNIQDKVASAENSHTRDGHYKTLTINVTSPGKTNQEPPKENLTEPAENQYMNVTQVKEKPLEKTWSTPEADSKQIKVFEIIIAGDSHLIDVKVILGVYQDVQKWQLENSNQPITVMCMNGARYSGQYVGCCNVFEMISGDQEVDVFQIAKYIRESRQEFLPTQAQYNNLYEAAALYVQQNSLADNVYQNIQAN